ncbi:MAG TPA: hypothetical protein V6C88_16940 [Chroococcidiopsis sp.]
MLHGLLWFPLLIAFIWLAWAGWNEYQKLEAYRVWAAQFDRAKYDIYAVLGQKDDTLTWGKPTRSGPVELQQFSLTQVTQCEVQAGDLPVDPNHPPKGDRNVTLAFHLRDQRRIQIPFTELALALQWHTFLQQEIKRFQAKSIENLS